MSLEWKFLQNCWIPHPPLVIRCRLGYDKGSELLNKMGLIKECIESAKKMDGMAVDDQRRFVKFCGLSESSC